jgi:hypothetical protein
MSFACTGSAAGSAEAAAKPRHNAMAFMPAIVIGSVAESAYRLLKFRM